MTEPSHNDRRQSILAALEQYERRLVRYAVRLLGDEPSARDVVQHAFVRLCEQPPEAVNGQIGPWLFTVCRNRAIDLIRAKRRTESLDAPDAAKAAGTEPDPADAVEQNDLYARLRQCVAELPDAQREAVELWTDGFSYREIAQIMETNEGNIRVLTHRGLKKLREHPIAQQLAKE